MDSVSSKEVPSTIGAVDATKQTHSDNTVYQIPGSNPQINVQYLNPTTFKSNTFFHLKKRDDTAPLTEKESLYLEDYLIKWKESNRRKLPQDILEMMRRLDVHYKGQTNSNAEVKKLASIEGNQRVRAKNMFPSLVKVQAEKLKKQTEDLKVWEISESLVDKSMFEASNVEFTDVKRIVKAGAGKVLSPLLKVPVLDVNQDRRRLPAFKFGGLMPPKILALDPIISQNVGAKRRVVPSLSEQGALKGNKGSVLRPSQVRLQKIQSEIRFNRHEVEFILEYFLSDHQMKEYDKFLSAIMIDLMKRFNSNFSLAESFNEDEKLTMLVYFQAIDAGEVPLSETRAQMKTLVRRHSK